MKLLYSPASPYAAKVRMAARHLDIEIVSVKVDTATPPPELLDSNPLTKIPTLLREDEPAIYDSVAIMHYLDRLSDGKLYPGKDPKRTTAEVLEALCDGMLDSLLAIMNERRSRPEELVYQPWIDKQWGKVSRGLDHLEADPPKAGHKLNGGDFALAALLSYLDLRFADRNWREGRPALSAWLEAFQQDFPDFEELKAGA